MARFALLYSDENGIARLLIVNDEPGHNLPHGDNVGDILSTHGEDYNDGASVFVVELPENGSGDPAFFVEGEELERQYVTL